MLHRKLMGDVQMDSVKIIRDSERIKLMFLYDILDSGVSMSDGKYLFIEDNEYVAVTLENGDIFAETLSSRKEAMLWLLDYEMWKYIYETEEYNEN